MPNYYSIFYIIVSWFVKWWYLRTRSPATPTKLSSGHQKMPTASPYINHSSSNSNHKGEGSPEGKPCLRKHQNLWPKANLKANLVKFWKSKPTPIESRRLRSNQHPFRQHQKHSKRAGMADQSALPVLIQPITLKEARRNEKRSKVLPQKDKKMIGKKLGRVASPSNSILNWP